MSNPFLAQIKVVGFGFAPKGWATCQGQILAISTNTALFSLLGTTYGGNGQTTFALPDLQGRAAMSFGQGPGLQDYVLGEEAGENNVTLLSTEMPSHTHPISGAVVPNSTTTNTPGPTSMFTNASPNALYAVTNTGLLQLHPLAITLVGGSQPHNNTQPCLGMYFIIATSGIFPARN